MEMPTASSTRAAAALIEGAIDGCTQPASAITRRACRGAGHIPAARASGTLACSVFGSRPRTD